MRDSSNKGFGFIIFILIVLLILAGIFLFSRFGKKIVSPVPPEPDFKVIYYTPTPEQSLTSTPSATPKIKSSPTSETKIKPTVTSKPTPSVSATVTP